MSNYEINVWDGEKRVHFAKTRAKSEKMAKSKCLSDCWKLDKMLGMERPWHLYRWDIVESNK